MEWAERFKKRRPKASSKCLEGKKQSSKPPKVQKNSLKGTQGSQPTSQAASLPSLPTYLSFPPPLFVRCTLPQTPATVTDKKSDRNLATHLSNPSAASPDRSRRPFFDPSPARSARLAAGRARHGAELQAAGQVPAARLPRGSLRFAGAQFSGPVAWTETGSLPPHGPMDPANSR